MKIVIPPNHRRPISTSIWFQENLLFCKNLGRQSYSIGEDASDIDNNNNDNSSPKHENQNPIFLFLLSIVIFPSNTTGSETELVLLKQKWSLYSYNNISNK